MRPLLLRIFCGSLLSCCLVYLYLRRRDIASSTFARRPVEHFGETRPQCQQCPFAASPFRFSDTLTAHTHTRGIIQPHFNNHDRNPSLGRIEEPFLPAFLSQTNTLNSKYSKVATNCSQATVVHVEVDPDPDPGPSDDSTKKILFGAATTVERLEKALHRLAYSVGGTKASMIALVPPADNLEEKQTHFRTRGLDIALVPSELDFTLRYFSLVRALNVHASKSTPGPEWMILVDDDTFFPSLPLVAQRLSTLSSSKPYWIGTVSEASWQVENFGHIAFGGAGILLSRNLVETLDGFYDECTGEELGPPEMPGDQRLGRCINKALPTLELTIWSELHQWDMRPEPHGLFEAGKPIWSFHHFHGGQWSNANVIGISAVATVAGDRSILRRWAFNITGSGQEQDRDFWVLTNGYSIVHYHIKAGAPDINFEHTEHTWDDAAEGYEESLGPLRPVDQEGVTKKRWLLRDAVKVGANVHQFYRYESTTETSVIEIVWLVSRMASEKPKRDLADIFRPYAKSNVPKSIPAKRPSPTLSDQLDGNHPAEEQLGRLEPRTPATSTRLKNAALSPYKSPFAPSSGASLNIPIRSPKPTPYKTSIDEFTPSLTVSRKGNLFASTSPKKDQEEKTLSFADIPTLTQTVVKDGKVIAVKGSDGEDSDSLCSLDDILGINRPDTATESSPPPDPEESDLEEQRARSLSIFTSGRYNTLVGRDKLRELSSKANGFNFDISLLVGDHFDDEEIEANVIKAKEGYKSSTDQERLKGQNFIDKNLLSSVVNQDEGDGNLERLFNAVERTEALASQHTWSMFHSRRETPRFFPTHSFPIHAVESEPWHGRLRDRISRTRAYLSGYVAEKALEGAIHDDVITWTLHSIIDETKDDLRTSYLRVVKAASPSWTFANLTSTLIEETFCRLGADPDKVTCVNDIELGPQLPTDHSCARRTQLMSTVEVLLSMCIDMTPQALSKFIKLLMRLALDTNLMNDSQICVAVEDAISSLLGHIDGVVSVSAANYILGDIGLCVRDPFLQMQALKHILPTSSAAARLRIQLANVFLLSVGRADAAFSNFLSSDINLPQLTAHLYDSRYDISHSGKQATGFDYGTLSSSTYIFDTALANGGRPSTFPDASSEQDFNRKVDTLAERITSIIRSIADTGASHMRRTEAKEALNALLVRVLYTVRTKPRLKKSVFGGRDGADYRAEARSAGMMQQFLARREGEKALKEREARSAAN